MLEINGFEISLTRGDTAYLEIPLVNKINDEKTEPYEMRSDDTLVFTVKRNLKDTEVCFQKKVTGTNVFHIEPKDTCEYEFGKYVYDVELKPANGDNFTVITHNCFKITPEVGC